MRGDMNNPKVLVIDAGLGNIGSVKAAFERLNCKCERLEKPPAKNEYGEYSHAVLPGVGSFETGVSALRSKGWEDWIKNEWCDAKRPFLGICLGMQLLATCGTEGSTSDKTVKGLDLIPGLVDILEVDEGIKLPHVGWNAVHWHETTSKLAFGLPKGGDMYFVHSYAFRTEESAHQLAYSEHGKEFTSVVARGSCYGVQFHPEKSQRLGRHLLKNFLNLE